MKEKKKSDEQKWNVGNQFGSILQSQTMKQKIEVLEMQIGVLKKRIQECTDAPKRQQYEVALIALEHDLDVVATFRF